MSSSSINTCIHPDGPGTKAMIPLDASGNVSVALTAWPSSLSPVPLVVSNTGAANGALTVTLPAVAAKYHYISNILIQRVATAAVAGTALLNITTTNLPGTLQWNVGNAIAAGGTNTDVSISMPSPLKSSVLNTDTTIVCPAPGAACYWVVTVIYVAAT